MGVGNGSGEATIEQTARSTVIRNIFRMLEDLDITRNDAANQAGIDPSGLYRTLQGRKSISIDLLARLADALGYHMQAFFADEGELLRRR